MFCLQMYASSLQDRSRSQQWTALVFLFLTGQILAESSLVITTEPLQTNVPSVSYAGHIWHHGEYTRCPVSCGGGIQFSKVYCYNTLNNKFVEDSKCDFRDRPEPKKRKCKVQLCNSYRWVVNPWKKCSNSCGVGTQFRNVYCVFNKQKRVKTWRCSWKIKPIARRKCRNILCAPEWRFGEWSECSRTCGEGIQTRAVTCRLTSVKDKAEIVDKSKCTTESSPSTSQPCVIKPCEDVIDDNSEDDEDYEESEHSDVSKEDTLLFDSSNQIVDDRVYSQQGIDDFLQRDDNDVQDDTQPMAPEIRQNQVKNIILKTSQKIKVSVGTRVSSVKGSTITVSCSARGEPVPVIKWFSENGRRIEKDGINVRALLDGKLRIKKVNNKAIGKYTCEASNIHGKSNLAFFVNIYVPNKPVILTSVSSLVLDKRVKEVELVVGTDATVYSGSKVTIRCQVTGDPPPTVRWTSQGRPIPPGKATVQGNVLIINNIDRIYSQEYTCQAQNRFGVDEFTSKVEVIDQVKPTIKFINKTMDTTHTLDATITIGTNLTVVSGSQITILCPIKDGAAEIGWLFNQKEISKTNLNDKYDILDEGTKLVINKVNFKDSGTYTCQASNSAGDIHAFSKVSIDAAVPPVITTKGGNIPALKGEKEVSFDVGQFLIVLTGVNTNVKINCPNTAGKPKPVVTWSKEGTPVVDTPGRFKIDPDTGMLLIYSIRPQDGGKYKCTATNKVGFSSAEAAITGITPLRPTIRKETGDIFAGEEEEEKTIVIGRTLKTVEGVIVNIECPVSGVPKPSISWSRNGKPIDTSTDKFLLEGRTGTLTINSITLFDGGLYKCTATNPAGSRNAISRVSIVGEMKASIHTGSGETKEYLTHVSHHTVIIGTHLKILRGSKLSVVCPFFGVPQPALNWEVNGVPLRGNGRYTIETKQNSSVLTLDSVSSRDIGTYKCLVSNTVGFDDESSNVLIVDPVVPVIIEGLDSSEPIRSVENQKKVFATIHNEITVLEGSPVTIICNASGVPPPKIVWKRGQQLLTSDDHILVNYARLSFLSAKLDDAGTYECNASNLIGSVLRSTTMTVIALEKPEIISKKEDVMALSPGTVSAGIGSSVTSTTGNEINLLCEVKGVPFPTLQWFKGTVMIQDGGETYTIKDIALSNAGDYKCVATSIAGKDEEITILKVLGMFAPKILASDTVVESLENLDPIKVIVGGKLTSMAQKKVTISCPVEGIPPPVITWSQGGRVIEMTENMIVESYSNGSSDLVLFESSPFDSGEYVCAAVNHMGNDSASIIVTILGPSAPVINGSFQEVVLFEEKGKVGITIGSDLNTLLGTIITIDCPASGVPKPTVSWFHKGTPISDTDTHYEILTTPFSSLLLIHDAQVVDSGEYKCRVQNTGGSVIELSNVIVLEPLKPTIRVERLPVEWLDGLDPMDAMIGNDIIALVGSEVNIQCIAEGRPPPKLKWTVPPGITISLAVEQDHETVYSNYSIVNATPRIAGKYTCTATNTHGRDSQSAKLTFVEPQPPKIITKIEHVTAVDGQNDVKVTIGSNLTTLVGTAVEILCPVDGLPKPEVSWTHNDVNVVGTDVIVLYQQKGTGVYSTKGVTLQGKGTYICQATNFLGSKYATTHVEIIDPIVPKILSSDLQLEFLEDITIVEAVIGNKVKMLVGSTFILKCPSTGTPPPVITWRKGDIPVLTETRVKMDGDTLEIRGTMQSDMGEYICVATNAAGEDIHTTFLALIAPMVPMIETGRGVVVSLDRKPLNLLIGQTLHALTGTKVTVQCASSAVPKPKLNWKTQKGKNLRKLKHFKINDEKQQLTIVSTLKDTGPVACIAKNSAGRDRQESQLNFSEPIPPKIKSSNRNLASSDDASLMMMIGDKLTTVVQKEISIECFASGHPPPKVGWLRDGLALASGGRYIINASMLTIKSAQPSDAGKYTCRASNLVGTDLISSYVNVIDPIRPQVLPPPKGEKKLIESIEDLGHIQVSIGSNMKVLTGTTITFHCLATGVPLPLVSWYKDDIKLKGNQKWMNIGKTSNGSSLTITGVMPSDTGTYTCTAMNLVGEESASSELEVVDPFKPDILESKHDFVVLDGKPVVPLTVGDTLKTLTGTTITINCTAVGIPTPVLGWTRDGQILISAGSYSLDEVTTNVPGTATLLLTIKSAQILHSASYICTASNIGGYDVKASVLETVGKTMQHRKQNKVVWIIMHNRMVSSEIKG